MTEARVRTVLTVVALVSFLASVGAILFGRRLAGVEGAPLDSFSSHALGTKACFETLSALGVHVSRRTNTDGGVQGPLLFVEPDVGGLIHGGEGEAEGAGGALFMKTLTTRRASSLATGVVLPKWKPDGLGAGVALLGLDAVEHLLALVDAAERAAGRVGPSDIEARWVPQREGTSREATHTLSVAGKLGLHGLVLPSPQTLRVQGAAEVLLGTRDAAFVVASPDGRLVLISDPDLVHNFNLHRGENARVLHTVLEKHLRSDAIMFDEVFHGHTEGRSLGEALGRFPAVLFSLHGVATCLMVVLLGLVRFGPPWRAPSAAPRSPLAGIRNAAAVMALARGSAAWTGMRYVECLLSDMAERLAVHLRGPRERAAAMDALLERRGGRPGARALFDRAHRLTGTAGRGERPSTVVRDAFAFRARVLGRRSVTTPDAPGSDHEVQER